MKLFLSLSVLFTAVLAQASPKCVTGKIVAPNSDAALLFQLVQKNDVEGARTLLKQSAIAFDAVDENCETPVQVAIRFQFDSMVETISQAYPDATLNQYLPNGWTPYGYALKSGSIHVVQAFQTRGARAVQSGVLRDGGNSPLEIAAYGNNIPLMQKLIAEGAIVNPKPEARGYTLNAPISLAVAGHSVEAVQLLIASQAKLSGAVLSNIVEGLGSISPLMIAASLGYADLVEILLQSSADPREIVGAGRSVLHVMKMNAPDSLRMLQLIIQAKGPISTPDSYNHTPLHRFIENGWTEGALTLIQAGARLELADDNFKENALTKAVRKGLNSVVSALLQAKANVNFKGSAGNTALIYAVQRNNEDVIHQLVEAGADVNLANQSGEVPLMFAPSTDLANYLISQRADLSLRDRNGATLIMRLSALPQDLSSVIASLIRKGYDLNAVDSKKNTALHYAAKSGPLSTIQVLLQGGITSTLNQDQKSAYDLAYAAKRDSAILNLLSRNSPAKLSHDTDCQPSNDNSQQLFDLIQKDKLDAIQSMMVQSPVAVDAYGKECMSPWMMAMELRRESIMNYFSEVYTDADVNKVLPNRETLYTYALMHGNLDLVNRLKAKGGGLDHTHWAAVANKQTNEVMLASMNRKEVLEEQINVITPVYRREYLNKTDGRGFNALTYAATHSANVSGIHEVIATLLANGAAPGNTLSLFFQAPLAERRAYGSRLKTYVEMNQAKKELALTADVLMSNPNSYWVLDAFHQAAAQTNPALLRVLLKHTQNPAKEINLKDSKNLTPLHRTFSCSALTNNADCLETLAILAGAGVNLNEPYPSFATNPITTYSGKTLLMVAAENGNLSLATALIRLGAKINLQPESTRASALMLALPQKGMSEESRIPMIQLLLQAGADKALKNSDRKTAYDLAKERNLSAKVLGLLSI